MPADSIVHVDDRSSLLDAINRMVWRDRGNTRFPAQVIWGNTGTTYPLILVGTTTNHLAALLGATAATATPSTSNAVLLVQDAAVSIGAGKELRLYNPAGSNYVNLLHSTTNDILKTDDGLWVAVALGVGVTPGALGAGDALLAGDLRWKSGTNFVVRFDHAATADRTVTFQDATGTVPLLGVANATGSLQISGDLLFSPDNTYDVGPAGATRPRDLFMARSIYLNDNTNANVTTGITLNQGAADDQAIALKSSDVAHGMTSFCETDTYGALMKVSAAEGGLLARSLTEGTTAFQVEANATTDNATKSTTGTAHAVIAAWTKSGTTSAAPGANANLFSVASGNTARFFLDADGDSHQDVGTAWTNFDALHDVAALNTLSRELARPGNEIRAGFGEFLQDGRAALERAGIVAFNEDADGRAFVNMSKLTMLLVGAARQLGAEVASLKAELASLKALAQPPAPANEGQGPQASTTVNG